MQSNDLLVFTFSDLKRLFLRNRSKIKTVAWIGASAAFLFLLIQQPVYRMEATFKQAGKEHDLNFNMKEMFQQFMGLSTESAAMPVMQSNEVIRGIVEDLGLQAECDRDLLITAVVKRIGENLWCEFGGKLSDCERFVFSHVAYPDEQSRKMFLKLTQDGGYQLYDKEKKLLGQAKLGQQLSLPSTQLTLESIPKNAKADRFYSLVLNPWEGVVKGLQKKIKIAPIKSDKTILKLELVHRDRILGSELLNRLMLGYQNYLKKENSEICQKQFAYLQGRQEELTRSFDQALGEHASYLKENLVHGGFLGFAQELDVLSAPKTLYTSKLFDIDLELNRLSDVRSGKVLTQESARKGKLVHQLKNKKDRATPPLHPQSDRLSHSLDNCEMEQMRCEASVNKPYEEEIHQISEQIQEAAILLESVEMQGKVPETPSLSKDPKSAIALLVKQIAGSREMASEGQMAQNSSPTLNPISCLKEFIVQLEQKRQILEEDYKLRKSGVDEFSGLSLDTARGLLVEYTRQRDSLQAQMRELVFLRDQMGRSEFEMSSLGGVFEDGVTRDIVNKASAIALQLKDENNRSMREQERLVETLQTQKNFLSHYLFQTVDLKRLRVKLLGDKIASLQQTTLTLLETEKQLLMNKLDDLNAKMSDLPDKWRRETMLVLKKELGSAMLEGIFQLAETKSLSQNIFYVSSRPLDQAFPPVRPHPKKMILISFIAAFFAGLGCFFIIFCRSLLKGLPVSDENLKVSGFPVGGKLTQYCNAHLAELRDQDLETLRSIAALITSKKTGPVGVAAVCIGGKYPDYSLSLAEILAMRGLRTLVIQCVFDKVVPPDDIPGLWQYIHGHEGQLPVRRHLTHDLLPCGGTSRHGAEIVSTPKFQSLLERVKQNYDVVLVFSSADAATAEGYCMLKMADAAIITVQQESKDQLAVYYDWAQQKGDGSAAFVYVDEFSS